MEHKLWQRKLADGAEVSAALQYAGGVGATITLVVQSAHGEDMTAIGLADELRKLLDANGAIAIGAPKAA
jgi:hypothetical protein